MAAGPRSLGLLLAAKGARVQASGSRSGAESREQQQQQREEQPVAHRVAQTDCVGATKAGEEDEEEKGSQPQGNE